MENRKRNVHIIVRVTEDERTLIEEKMRQIPTMNLSAYSRKMLIDRYIIVLERNLRRRKDSLHKAERRIEELDRLFKRIYEDNANGKISDSRFQMLSDDYEQEQTELREKLLQLNEEITQQEEQAENIDRFIGKVKKYLDLDELTPAVLNDMVKAVYVHTPDKLSGRREQQIDISYDLVGILPASLLYDLQNGETA